MEDIYGTLTGNKDLYSTAKPLFETHFTPKKNVELKIFTFRRTHQEPAENMDAFVTRLRQQATRSTSANADLEIKLQIIQGCRSNAFRKACLRDNLGLDKILENVRGMEAANRYAEIIEQSGRQATNAMKNSKNRKTPKGRHGIKKICRQCGGQWPHANNACPCKEKCRRNWPHSEANSCPAKGKDATSMGNFRRRESESSRRL